MAINGTSGNDFLTGTNGADTISGFDGADEINGLKGADLLLGGDGDDRIDGGDGNNRIDGGTGNDQLNGGQHDDSILGGAGNDVIGDGLGNDTVDGGDGHDFFFRTSDDNRIFGGAGNDTYNGGAGSDIVNGGGGDDVFFLEGFDNSGTATISGAGGRDLYVFRDYPGPGPAGPTIHVINDFDAGPGGDRLDLDELLTTSGEVFGYEGGNPFNSAVGVFRLTQDGADTLLQWDVGPPNIGDGIKWVTVLRLKNLSASTITADNVVGGIPPDGSAVPGDVLMGSADADTLQGGFFNDTIYGSDGDDALDGRGGDDTIVGGSGNDTITGGAGNDRLSGNDGDDLFVVDSTGTASVATGGAGADTYRLEIGFLKLNRGYTVTDFAAGAGGDLIDVNPLLAHSTLPFELGYNGGNPFDPDVGFLRWRQSDSSLKLQWDSDGPDDARFGWQTVLTLKNREASDLTPDNFVSWIPPDGSITPGRELNGTAAAERLLGSLFNDTVSGLDANDTLDGNAGHDVIDGGEGNDTLAGGVGNDTAYGGAGTDYLDGGTGNDWLFGGDGDDEFRDGFGKDRFFGGEGNDTFHFTQFFNSVPGSATATGGAGVDLFAVSTSSRSLKDVVTDFAAGAGGDQIDFGGPFFIPGPDSFAQGYVRLRQSGSHTLFQWDRDGAAGSEFGWGTILTLRNVTASAITSDNFLGELVVGTTGNDDLLGGLGNDTVRGLAGNDTLDGSLGKDILEGGFGDDLYYVDDADDLLVETSNTAGALLLPGAGGAGQAVSGAIDSVISSVNYSLAGFQFVENLTLAGKAARATGNALGNILQGNAGADVLDGAGGNDTLDGGKGRDQLLGAEGNDVLVWGAGDRLNGGAGDDVLKVKAGDLDLTAVADSALAGIEAVDLRKGGASALTLSRADVLALNGADTLRVLGDAGDSVNALGFARSGSLDGFKRYTSGAATLLVDTDITVT